MVEESGVNMRSEFRSVRGRDVARRRRGGELLRLVLDSDDRVAPRPLDLGYTPPSSIPVTYGSSPFAGGPSGAPDSHDLNACLTDATIPALPDAPDPGQPGAPAGTDSLCWFGPGGYVDGEVKHKVFSLPDDVCTDGVARATFLASFSNPMLLCLTDMVDYLCSGSYQEQAWGFHGNVVAHVYDQASEAGRVQQIFDECVQDMLAWKNPPTQQLADHFASIYGQMFQLAACNSTATLQGKQP